jgi:truncated hemoglobin YjbI
MPLALRKVRERSKVSARREVYTIARAHQHKFAQAFRRAMRALVTDEVLRKVKQYLDAGNLAAAVATIPTFTEQDIWQRFEAQIANAYAGVLRASGQNAFDRLKIRARFAVAKATPEKFGARWIRQRSAALVVDITQGQREALQQVIYDNFHAGKSSDLIVDQVRSVVGLTERDSRAVQNRYALHINGGFDEEQAEELADQYAEQLLDARALRIAQTETVSAEAQGRREAWGFAKEQGIIPQHAKRIWVTSDDPCDECEALSDTTAELDGTFPGGWIGAPLHPNCVCSEMLSDIGDLDDEE